MKQMKIFRCFAACAVILTGCSKSNLEEPWQNNETTNGATKVVEFDANYDMTKATLDGYKVSWEANDEIGVYDGVALRKFTIKEANGSSATFEGEVDINATEFYAVAPYSAAASSLPLEGKVYFNLPSEQTVTSGVASSNALVAIAKAVSGNFSFKNAVSLIKVSVPAGATSVTIKGADSEMIAGSAASNIGEDPTSGNASEVILKPSSATFDEGEYCIAVLPTSFDNGFSIAIADNDVTTTYSTSKSLTIKRNQIVAINTASADKSMHFKNIKNAEDLKAFASSAEEYASDEIVYIANDIDLNKENWTSIPKLKCTLDGQGHKIYNLTNTFTETRGGFIGVIDKGAVLKNLVFGSSEGTTYDGESYIDYSGTAEAYQGLVSECFGTISGVKSFVSMKHESTDPGMRLGGIVGCIRETGKMDNCEFAGKISVGQAVTTANYFVGGLVGRMHQNLANDITISDCVFSGNIVIENDHVQGTGGIVGIMQGGNISRCASKGQVEIKASYTNDSHFGGIAAYIQTGDSQNTATISECTNSTSLSSSAYLCSVGGIVGDIHNYSKLIKIENCTNEADITVNVAPIAQSYLSGIVGFVRDGSSYPHEITSCTNNGKIIYSNALSAKSDFQIFTAGVLGFSKNSAGVVLKDCINNGAVSSNLYAVNSVAGIAGYLNKTSSVSSCTNNAAITLNPSTAVELGWQGGAAGIAAWLSGACTVNGNRNYGNVTMNIKSSSPSHAAGGVTALIDADGSTLGNNVNKGNVSLTTTNKIAAVGGIIGITKSTTTLEGNANYGDVSFIKPGETGDCFAGGVIGKIDCGSAAKNVKMTSDKSLGAITSPMRAAVLFSVIAWDKSPAVTMNLSECGIGGSVNGTAVSADNYLNYVWSWVPSSGCTITGKDTCQYVSE